MWYDTSARTSVIDAAVNAGILERKDATASAENKRVGRGSRNKRDSKDAAVVARNKRDDRDSSTDTPI